MARKCDIEIDIMKFVAVSLIINSHADLMYPKPQILATEGAMARSYKTYEDV